MPKPRIVVVLLASVVLVGLIWVAWNRWPPLLRYRIRQNDQESQGVILDYLNGRRALEPSAKALAALWRSDMELMLRLPTRAPPGGESLTAVVAPLPAGVRRDDPRLAELGNRAMALSMEPEVWQRFQQMRRENGDTT